MTDESNMNSTKTNYGSMTSNPDYRKSLRARKAKLQSEIDVTEQACGTKCKLCSLSVARVVALMTSTTQWGCIKLGCPIMHFRSDDYREVNDGQGRGLFIATKSEATTSDQEGGNV